MNQTRVDHIIKLCLAAAAQRDLGERELGPIHLIKYVYLADLLYSQRHDGETYTGTPWIFYHFGPYSIEVLNRVEPVAHELGANEKRQPSQYKDGEWVRWCIDDELLFEELERGLPLEIAVGLPGIVKQFGGDTYTLLNHVYLTDPILRAAPNEPLDFTPPQKEEDATTCSDEALSTPPKLSVKKRKMWEAKRQTLRDRIKAKAQEIDKHKEQKTSNPPIYDDVYLEGIQWLDSLAGQPVQETSGSLVVDESVWKSRARGERDVP